MWEIEIFTTGCVLCDAGSHVVVLMRNFHHRKCSLLWGSHVVVWKFEIFTTGSVPFDGGSHVVVWKIEIFTTGSVAFDAGS